MLDIVASYHCIQFQGKLMIQTQENGKKPFFGLALQAQWAHIRYMQFQGKYMIQNQENCEKLHFGPDLGTLGPNSGLFSKIWLCQSLDTMVVKTEWKKSMKIERDSSYLAKYFDLK